MPPTITQRFSRFEIAPFNDVTTYTIVIEWDQSTEEEIIDLQGIAALIDEENKTIETPIFYGNIFSKDHSVEMQSMHFPTSFIVKPDILNHEVKKIDFYMYSAILEPSKSQINFEKEIRIILKETATPSNIYITKIFLKCELPKLIRIFSVEIKNKNWICMADATLLESDLIKELFKLR